MTMNTLFLIMLAVAPATAARADGWPPRCEPALMTYDNYWECRQSNGSYDCAPDTSGCWVPQRQHSDGVPGCNNSSQEFDTNAECLRLNISCVYENGCYVSSSQMPGGSIHNDPLPPPSRCEPALSTYDNYGECRRDNRQYECGPDTTGCWVPLRRHGDGIPGCDRSSQEFETNSECLRFNISCIYEDGCYVSTGQIPSR